MHKILVGIPAYNEEGNISHIVKDLLAQKLEHYMLEVLVVSDGSTDATVEEVRSIKDPRVSCLDEKVNVGLALTQNKIILKAMSYDFLLIVNADIRITDIHFLSRMLEPIKQGSDIVSCPVLEVLTASSFSHILAVGNRIKRDAFSGFKKGDNWFNCHGSARAFSNKFIKSFRFKQSIWEDTYSYLFAKAYGYKFTSISTTCCFYSIPSNLSDHLKQTKRFLTHKNYILEEFGNSFVKENTRWPFFLLVNASIKEFLHNPLLTIQYLLVFTYSYLYAKLNSDIITQTWVPPLSTRKVNIEMKI